MNLIINNTGDNKGVKMKPVKIRTQVIPISRLKPIDINPTYRTDPKTLKNLTIEIKKTSVITPPILILDDKDNKFWIIDGSRRYEIAKNIGYDEIYCNIIDMEECKVTRNDLFISLNTQLKFSGYQKLWLMKHYDIFFHPVEKNKKIYTWLLNIGGIDIIDLMLEKKKNATETYGWAKRVSKYLNYIMKEDISIVLTWIVEYNQQAKSRTGIDVEYDKGLWKQHIKEGKSLPFGAKTYNLAILKSKVI